MPIEKTDVRNERFENNNDALNQPIGFVPRLIENIISYFVNMYNEFMNPSDKAEKPKTDIVSSRSSTIRNVVGIIGTGIIAVYSIGSGILVDTSLEWYLSLRKPAWQPPSIVFGIIWPYNFTMLIVATWIVATRLSTAHRLVWLGFLSLSATSALTWAWLFFRSQLLLESSIALLSTTLLTVPLLLIAFRTSPALGIAFVPYQIWLALATSLGFGFAYMNNNTRDLSILGDATTGSLLELTPNLNDRVYKNSCLVK